MAKLECKPHTDDVLSLNSGWLPTLCKATVCNLVHRAYFTMCPVCKARAGWPGEWEGNAAFFRGAMLFGLEQSLWRKNKAENSYRLLEHYVWLPSLVLCSYLDRKTAGVLEEAVDVKS